MTASCGFGYPAVSEHLPGLITLLAILTFLLEVFSLEIITSSTIEISGNFRTFEKLVLTREFLPHRFVAESQHSNLINKKFSTALL